jgi:AcrR family transcriptional regulator
VAQPSADTALPVERRQELLDALEQILLAEGFAGTTLDEFAARLKCSKSTLYRVAPSKEQLVAAAARHFFSGATTRIEAAVADADMPAEKLEAYLTTVGREMRRGSREFHQQMATQPPTADVYARNARAAADRVGELIHAGVATGEFRIVDADFAALAVGAVLNAIHTGEMAGSSLDESEPHARLSELVLYGLLGRDADRRG